LGDNFCGGNYQLGGAPVRSRGIIMPRVRRAYLVRLPPAPLSIDGPYTYYIV